MENTEIMEKEPIKKQPVKKQPLKKQQVKKEDEEFFVALNDANSVRIHMLESTKKVLESMKLFREIKDIRKQKLEEKRTLKKHLRQVSKTLNRIKSEMPRVHIPSEQIQSIKKMSGRKKELQPVVEKKDIRQVSFKPKTDIDKIEQDLSEIEAKLSSLSQA